MIKGWFSRLLDRLFPYIPACVGCGIEKGAKDSLCPKCAAELHRLEAGQTDAAGWPAHSLYVYDGIVSRIVRGYKYGGKKWLSVFMGGQMAAAIPDLKGRFDFVCNVPLHKKRRASRGFDQAEQLARQIAQCSGLPFVLALRRVRNTKTQTKLGAAQRKENIRGAFEPNSCVSGRALLIDDVLTTGATAAECARVLINAGAQSVFVLTFARARLGIKP